MVCKLIAPCHIVVSFLIGSALVLVQAPQSFAQTSIDEGIQNRSIGAQLRKMKMPPGQAASIASRLGLKYRGQKSVQISFDPRSGELIVMAPSVIHNQINAQVDRLLEADRNASGHPSTSGEFTYQLRYQNWQQFEREFQKLSLTPALVTHNRTGQLAAFRLTTAPLTGSTIEVHRQSGAVHVITSSNKTEAWRKLIAAIDEPILTGDEVTTLLRLKNAEPAPIQRAIRLLSNLEQRLKRQRDNLRASSERVSQNQTPFRTAAFQVEQDDPGTSDNRNENQPVDEAKEAGAGVIGDTQIEFVPELGTIIIKGAKRDVQRVMDVIKEIEAQSEVTKPDVEVVQLQHADSNAVATLLKQLYDDVLSARQGSVSITSLDAPNALLLIGRAEAIKSLLELIQKIDQPVPESDRMRIFRLQNASATDVEQTIRDFFSDRPGTGDDLRPGLGNRVRVLGDYRTNSLIISASPRDMDEVSRLIGELDVQNIISKNQIKVFPLNNALAEDLAPVIQDAINGTDDGDDSNITNPSNTLSIVALNSDGGRVLDSGILAGATVTADASANAVVVRATSASMPLIGELIRQLDQSPGIDSLVKVFTIENGDALQLTAALQDLFGDDASTGGTSIGAGNLAGLPSSTGGIESSLVPLRFSTDQRTNAIIASGSAEDLEVVESILLRLDSAGFADRITEVVWLRHQGATEVSAALQAYVQQRTQTVNTIQQFQQGLGPFDLPDRDLIVVAEPVTNSILLSVSPRLYEDVRRLIDRLDRRPPMVMIQVVIAEVSLDDFFEVGGELGLQDSLRYDRGIAAGAFPGATAPSNPGFNFNGASPESAGGLGNSFGQNTVAGRGVSSLGVGTSNAALGYGGLVLSAASDSVSLLFRTLQDANRLQILSRPQVMTLDNVEAAIQVGRQVARIRDVTQSVTGSLVSTEDIQVGLILRIRPRVGADGLIIVDVDTERSARDQANGTPIPDGAGGVVIIDDIVTTNAQSTIAAYSGQTVVFGGLIQKTRTNTSQRVPFMADIPVVGNSFKYDREAESRSELLVFMTPTLVTGDEDLEYIKQAESSRMSWCLADVVEMHGDVGMSGGYGLWGPAIGQTIYPDMQPTVDDIIINDDMSVDSYPSGFHFEGERGHSIYDSGSAMLDADSPTLAAPYSVPNDFVPPGQPQAAGSSGPSWLPVPGNGNLPAVMNQENSPPAKQVSWLDVVGEDESKLKPTRIGVRTSRYVAPSK